MDVEIFGYENETIAKAVIEDYEWRPRKEGVTSVSMYGLKLNVSWEYSEDEHDQYGVWVYDIEAAEEDVRVKYDANGLEFTLFFMNEQRFPGPYKHLKEKFGWTD